MTYVDLPVYVAKDLKMLHIQKDSLGVSESVKKMSKRHARAVLLFGVEYTSISLAD